MAEDQLELRLRAVAVALDEQTPSFDAARLGSRSERHRRRRIAAIACIAALAGVAIAPAAVSALRGLFEVDVVTELGPLAPGVAPPFAGRSVSLEALEASAPFRVRTTPSLGAPDGARVRDDVTGGMVTLVYGGGRSLLTQWRTTDVSARVAVVPVEGRAEEVTVGSLSALWIEGAARGTFTLVGADGTVHRESFEVSPGVLLWMQEGMTFLLQGAGAQNTAIRLAVGTSPL
jgi:hypothetical protein